MPVEVRLPLFLNKFTHSAVQLSRKIVPQREFPQVPSGTNAFFMQYDGLRVGGLQTPGQEIIDIKREKGQCEGGACVEVLYAKPGNNGERTSIDVHIRGDDRIAFGGAYQELIGSPNKYQAKKIDTMVALQNLRDHLLARFADDVSETSTQPPSA